MSNDRLPWRTGRKVGRTIYQQVRPEPSDDDVLIGVMDTPAQAAEAVHARNVFAAAPTRATGPGKPAKQIFDEYRASSVRTKSTGSLAGSQGTALGGPE
jgi:hypothetical protein